MGDKIVLDWSPSDSALDNEDWEYLIESLQEIIDDFQITDWRVEGRGLGWQRRNGVLEVKTTSAADLLRQTLPETENTFQIVAYPAERKLVITNSHHDAQGEVYVLTERPQEVVYTVNIGNTYYHDFDKLEEGVAYFQMVLDNPDAYEALLRAIRNPKSMLTSRTVELNEFRDGYRYRTHLSHTFKHETTGDTA